MLGVGLKKQETSFPLSDMCTGQAACKLVLCSYWNHKCTSIFPANKMLYDEVPLNPTQGIQMQKFCSC